MDISESSKPFSVAFRLEIRGTAKGRKVNVKARLLDLKSGEMKISET